MTKSEIRKKYKAFRKSLSFDQVDDFSLSIANRLLQLDIWDSSCYHIFLSIEEQKEVNTEFILNILAGKDKNIVISKSNFDDISMTHYLLTDGTKIKKNNYNIPEPVDGIEIKSSQIDVVFIPLLAFDNSGNRIGYGKGFYDRFLSECKPETIKIGLSFFDAEAEHFETSENDIKLDYCVTPNQIYRF
ncbi:5-formyltetrahydrofolate cyclo-ligase [Winogradskyella aquimaris]|uniref:5-formyltetrahydrofolate cyclo-ligase n=1 Tax=Winogradskyella aquimaris TaxID=864074 RepID=A0ABU5EJS9_9FLAO|nr:5-formyltetrahydrofolate cyclo-ligase [Winogradskyella aquimaris]MDY2586309.1 5-formyltetrahydrofolate cyclo-ligase [Winogradskyella aquimaris]